MAAAERANRVRPDRRRLVIAIVGVFAMTLLLFALPLALADRIAPDLSMLGLMLADALLVALLAGSGASLGAVAALSALLALSLLTRQAGWVALPSIGMFTSLFGWFAWSLRRGGDPVVSAIARQVNGELDQPMVRYTRGLTLVWALFFAGMSITSALLSRYAEFATWSFFVNLLSWPLTAVVFLAEYLVRRLAFPGLPATGPLQVVEAVIEFTRSGRDAGDDCSSADGIRGS